MRHIALFLVLLGFPIISSAQTISQDQALQLSACTAPLSQAYTEHSITLEEFQYKMVQCYKSSGAENLIPPAWREATSAQNIDELNTRAREAIKSIWNNETIPFDAALIQEQLAQTTISQEQAIAISSCIAGAIPSSGSPQAAQQLAIAHCFVGTPYEKILAPLYQNIATVIDCSTDKLGVTRAGDITRLMIEPSQKEIAILKKCYIERTAPIVTSASLINIVAANGLGNITLLLFMILSHAWILLRHGSVPYGTVSNTLTKLPIDLAIIRLHRPENNTPFRTAVTDPQGRYYIFSEPGTYNLSVIKTGFVYPSTLAASPNLINCSEADPTVHTTLSVDPVNTEITHKSIGQKIRNAISKIIGYGSPIIGIVSAIIVPTWWIILLASCNFMAFFAFRYFQKRNRPTTFGQIIQNGIPLAHAPVRIFETTYNKLIASTTTDAKGRYGFFAAPGFYKLSIGEKEFDITVSKNNIIATEITL